jgi:hypothetical protein
MTQSMNCWRANSILWRTTVAAALAALVVPVKAAENTNRPISQWVYAGPDGKLVYKTTPAGDRIMDFSYAGYMGGGVALPFVPVKRTVPSSGAGDDTATIQAAINEVAALPLENGFRGAVLLAPGTFTCSGTITRFPKADWSFAIAARWDQAMAGPWAGAWRGTVSRKTSSSRIHREQSTG